MNNQATTNSTAAQLVLDFNAEARAIADRIEYTMPGIGILNSSKRIQCYSYCTSMADELAKDSKPSPMDIAMMALGMLSTDCEAFQKAAATAANRCSPEAMEHLTEPSRAFLTLMRVTAEYTAES